MKTLKTAMDLKLPGGKLAEVRVQTLRETPTEYPVGDTPDKIVQVMWELARIGEPAGWWQWDVETFFVMLMSTRRRVIAWELVSKGTLDTLLVHPREVFRLAIVANASAIVIAHTHPSGDPSPSEGDIRVTRDMVNAGKLLRIEVLDHLIIGAPAFVTPGSRGWASLRELGYFYN